MNTNTPDHLPGSLDSDIGPTELPEDPDDLELREEFSKELRASLEAAASGRPTRSADEVAKRQGLAW